MSRQELTEAEKIQILLLKSHGWRTFEIAHDLKRPESTIRTFMKKYETRHTLSVKRGRKRKPIPAEIEQRLVHEVIANPHLSLREQISRAALQVPMYTSRLWNLRHEHHIHCYQQKPVCPLTPDHKNFRVQFCNYILNQFDHRIPVIFTDESTVEIDLKLGPVWRPKGVPIVEEFYARPAHPMHVMIWGGIGPDGYRTSLIRCPGSVNGESYIHFLADNGIIFELNEKFGVRGYVFQQDNAPAHCVHRDVLANFVELFDWPAHSPDLSPIEQIWAYIKKKLKGKTFQTTDELFDALSREWQQIPNDKVSKYYTSFLPRCTVCAAHGGESLNHHWKEVHNLHHPRTPQ